MRKSIRLAFDETGYSLTGELVSGFSCSIQNFLICLGTTLESDRMFPDKGCTLRTDMLGGAVYEETGAAQVASISAGQVQFFATEHDTLAELPDAVRDVTIIPSSIASRKVRLELDFTSYDGQVTPALPTI